MSCYYSNADSLKNKKQELELIIAAHKPDIVIITELLPKNCDVPPTETEFAIKNYSLFSNIDDKN